MLRWLLVFNIPLVSKPVPRFSSRFPREWWSGPWAKEYTSLVTWLFTSRLRRLPDGHFVAHLEPGSVALHTITWQWINTNGWSAMNLKASRLNRWALVEGAEWYFIVMSLGQLKEQVTRNRNAKKGVWISKGRKENFQEISNTSAILIYEKSFLWF